MFTAFDHQCMARALALAKRGLYTTDPNPRVGCVLAHEGQIISEGWHKRAGGPHAEVYALRDADADAVRGATAYVTLEPCNHHGRTPSCAVALIESGISRVVAATEDPNPLVNGKGLDMLRQAGIQVDVGLAREQSEQLNPGFSMRMRSDRPFIRVKLAVSVDGRTALANGNSEWISSSESRRDVQTWRARSSAILTGIGTVLADDPSLNVRLDGTERQPVRVVVDSGWRTPEDARILSLPGQVLVAGNKHLAIPAHLDDEQVSSLPLPPDEEGRVSLPQLMKELAARGLNEVQVEAGATLCGGLLQAGLVDELLLYQAPVLLGSGSRDLVTTPVLESMQQRLPLSCIESVRVGPDFRLRYRLSGQAQ